MSASLPSDPTHEQMRQIISQLNFWRAQYFQSLRELTKANKGIRRLRAKLDRMKAKIPKEAKAK